MRPSNHTLLINSVIGLCKNGDNWIHPFYDLGYTPKLLEHTISLGSQKGTVKPDVVAASNKLLNAICFDCKGGRNIEEGQAGRYHDLSSRDLLRWIEVPEPDKLTHDTCFVGLEENQIDRTHKFDEFPKLIFGKEALRKVGTFSEKKVNDKLDEPMNLIGGMFPPTLYYPFSTTDDPAVMLPFVLRALVETSVRQKRSGNRQVNEGTFDTDDFRIRVHRMWNLMGQETRDALAIKIRDLVRTVMRRYPQFMEKVAGGQESSQVILSNLIPLCQKMLADEEKKSRIDDY